MREQPKYASTHTFAYLLIIFECIKIRNVGNETNICKRRTKTKQKSLNQTIFSMNKYFEKGRDSTRSHTHTCGVRVSK